LPPLRHAAHELALPPHQKQLQIPHLFGDGHRGTWYAYNIHTRHSAVCPPKMPSVVGVSLHLDFYRKVWSEIIFCWRWRKNLHFLGCVSRVLKMWIHLLHGKWHALTAELRGNEIAWSPRGRHSGPTNYLSPAPTNPTSQPLFLPPPTRRFHRSRLLSTTYIWTHSLNPHVGRGTEPHVPASGELCGPSARDLIPAPTWRQDRNSPAFLQTRITTKPAFVPGCACTRRL
jgi:hypothetical protein